MTDTTTPYATISDVKEANKARGHYWFSPATMSAFNTCIETGLYRGRYFITSEQREPHPHREGDRMEPATPRRYSVRIARDDGAIDTLGGEFNNYPDIKAAMHAMWGAIHATTEQG